MSDGGFTELGLFDDDTRRWRLMRCTTPSQSWLELQQYQRDIDDDWTPIEVTAVPHHVARWLAETISANVDEPPLTSEVESGETSPETYRVLETIRQKDWIAFMFTMREIHTNGRDCVNAIVAQLATYALIAMEKFIDDDERIEDVLARWLRQVTGNDIDDELHDDEITALLDEHSGNDD